LALAAVYFISKYDQQQDCCNYQALRHDYVSSDEIRFGNQYEEDCALR
jgi:hypothetical protein